MRQLGASPPDGWQGSHPGAGAISQGVSLGLLENAHEDSLSVVSAVNAVDYVQYLEYGTSRMAPFAMVRQALVRIQQSVRSLFRFP